MSDFKRLSQQDKVTFIQAHENIKEDELTYKFEEGVEKFEGFPSSREFILISKPEVTDRVWNSLVKSRIGKVIDFENGDSEPDYRKGMVVEKNLLEAFMQFIAEILQKIFGGLSGGKGNEADDDRAPGKPRRKRDTEDAYERR